MKLIVDIPEERYKDIKRIASVQLEMRADTAEQIIANGTPFDSVIKKGHWIYEPKKKMKTKFYINSCSACGKSPANNYATNFCPNCGADMRGE